MSGKNTLFLLLLVGALIGPAIYFNADWSKIRVTDNIGYSNNHLASIPVRGKAAINLSPAGINDPVSTVQVARPEFGTALNPSQADPAILPPANLPTDIILPGNAAGPDFNAVPLEFMPVNQLGDIFRFDVNPSWVENRWERVASASDESGLSGLRVPLVTGVNMNDLFGSLTYYFDNRQQLQRLSFRGWTGKPDGLVQFLSNNYEFKIQPTTASGLYVAKSWTKTTGALYMQRPVVTGPKNPTQKVAVLLEINNPNGNYQLTEEVSRMIYTEVR
ncbi:MAG: DUF6690 family protein [Planctomycetota bacterium]